MEGIEYAKQIITRYKNGENLDGLITELESETLKGPFNSAINLSSDSDEEPNIKPWNWLGLKLIEHKKYDESCKLWQRMIIMANLTASSFYEGVSYVGTPFNNLGVTQIKMKRPLDGFHSFLKAFEFDIVTSGTSQVARKNLLGILPTIQRVHQKGRKDIIFEYTLYAIGGGILVERILTMIIKCRGIEMNDLIFIGFSITIALISYVLPRITKLKISTTGIEIDFPLITSGNTTN